MTSVSQSPEQPGGEGPNELHGEAIALARDALNHIHPEGSFDLQVESFGGVVVIRATDNPEWLAKQVRPPVAEDLSSIAAILALGETRPEVGSIHEITVGGRTGKIKFDGMDSLANLVNLGLRTVRTAYGELTEAEHQAAISLEQRLAALTTPPAAS